MRRTVVGCYLHPDGRGYRDPANGAWRCIECEEEGDEKLLMDWRDYQDSGEDPERVRKRLFMRKHAAARRRSS